MSNRMAILCSGIIIGDNDLIRKSFGNRSHLRAFGFIPVTSASEDCGNLCPWIKIADRLQDIFQGIRGVSIVNNSEPARRQFYLFEAAAHRTKALRRLREDFERKSFDAEVER